VRDDGWQEYGRPQDSRPDVWMEYNVEDHISVYELSTQYSRGSVDSSHTDEETVPVKKDRLYPASRSVSLTKPPPGCLAVTAFL
jgi:hypothetical protein